MKVSSAAIILGVAALIALVPSRAEENEYQLGTSGRRLQDAITVGVGFTPATVAAAVSGDAISSSEDELVQTLESNDQVTVIGDVQLGELLCETLAEAENATVLNFPINADEAIIAEKISYDVLDGECFSDGMTRKVWNGKEVEDSIEGAHRTVSMTWGEECDVEMFLLKITTNYDDGTLFVLKSVPCEMGSGNETCIVEVELDLQESDEPEASTTDIEYSVGSDSQSRSTVSSGIDTQTTTTTTTIDVMLLYTEGVKTTLGGVGDDQVESTLATAIASSNLALQNSNVDAEFHLVYTGPLPYNETRTTDMSDVLYDFRNNDEVLELRTCAGADLVQLIVGSIDSFCGIGYLFTGDSAVGFSVASVNCIDGLTHTHELGHNLGCYHDRNSSDTQTDYAHGWRYCSGDDTYRTVMSYPTNCSVTRVNYFSNPDVYLYDKPTGQETADNARAIEDNMATVAGFESTVADPSTCGSSDLMDASERTEVTVSANAYDTRISDEGGCDPDGCVASNTRDSLFTDDSRWSCVNTLDDSTCRLTFTFDEAQDIEEINIAFYKGDERTRTFEVETLDSSGDTSTTEFTSSGETDGLETFALGSDETTELVISPASPNEDDWLSIFEVEIMVE